MTERERERERLIEIITKSVDGCAEYWAGLIADGLLESDAIVPPCKVGDTVYQIKGTSIKEYKVDYFDIFNNSVNFTFKIHLIADNWSDFVFDDDFGKTVFLSREEAKKALEECKENE